MKKIGLILCFITLGFLQVNAQTKKAGTKVLRHVVMFSFKEGSTTEQIKEVTDAFAALPQKIKQIKTFEWGTNNSPEDLAQGYTHCFSLSFASEKDRAIYLPHPAHKAFGDVLRPILDKVLVFDYWTLK
jgi:hypothetical protein